MKTFRFAAACALLLSLSSTLRADVSKTWQFVSPSEYVYDPVLIGVNTNPPGMAELLLQVDEKHHATFEEYTATNTTRAHLQMGFPTTIQMTKDPLFPELYSPMGSFVSRILGSSAGFGYVVARISNADHTGDPTLKAFYKMDDDNWRDAVSGSVAGTSGSPTFSTDAKQGTHSGLFRFANITLAGGLFMNNTRAFTVAAWIKGDVFRTYGAVLAHWAGGDQILFDAGASQGNPRFYLKVNNRVSSSTWVASYREWSFVVNTWDANGDGAVRTFVNGQLASVAPAAAAGTAFTQNTSLLVGSRPETGRPFDGFIDGFAIWNRALSFTEIADLYESYRITDPVRFQFRSADTESALADQVFVGPRGTTNSYYYGQRFLLESAGDFDMNHPFLQYRVELFASQNRVYAPLLQAVGVDAGGVMQVDRLHLDFLGPGHRFELNTTNTAVQTDASWSYLGLAKRKNGGYHTNGVFYSRVFTGGESAVTWDRISWTEGAQEVGRVGSVGLMGLYHCRSSWADDSGSGRSGTPSPSVQYSDLGKLGARHAVFDGTDAYVSAFSYGDNPIRSMTFWINNSNTDDAIMQIGADTAIVIRDRMIAAQGFDGAKPALYVNSRPVAGPLLQGWNHVALVWPVGVSAMGLAVGRVDVPTTDYMQGAFDELAVYDRALERSEIVQQFTVGRREVAGSVRFQVRSSDDPTFAGVPFVGPLGTASSYFTLAGAIPTPPARYCQYAAYLDGEGDATPALTSVTIGYDLLSKSQTDSTVEDFEKGTFVGATVRPYGQKIDLIDQSLLGPANLSRLAFPSLFGLWHLDESVWGDVIDEMGAGTGAGSGGARTSADTYIGVRCGEFDGIDDRVLLGNAPFAVSTFSVSLWFRSTTDQRRAVISSHIAGGAYFSIELNSDGLSNALGRVAFTIDDAFAGGRPVAVVARRTGLNDGIWHNVIGMRNGRQLAIYVDGALEGTATLPAFYGDANGGSPSLAYDSRLGYYAGYIDEVAFFTSALTARQISHICGAGVRTLETGEFVGPVVAAPDATIWDVIDWGVHQTIGAPLTGEDTSLVGLWHLDEASGASMVEDAVGGHHGSLIGSSGLAGKFGRCIQLGVATARVLIPDAAALEPQRLTVEAWANPNEPSAMTIADKRTASTGYALALDDNGRPYFWVGDGSSGVTAAAPIGLRVGAWSHVAGSYDGSRVRVYVNGRPRAEAALALANAETAGNDLSFGMNYQGGLVFVGYLDEAAIHNRALGSHEIEDHYAAGAASIRFQARAWDPDPLGEYVGPGMTNTAYFTEWYGSLLKGSVPLGRYLQYRALLSTDDYRFPPAMYGVHVAYSSYPLGRPPIHPTSASAFPFLANLTQFSDSKSALPGTDVLYQISADDGTTPRWFYWDAFGATPRWADATGLSPAYTYSSSAAQINQFINRFYFQWYNGLGGRFRFKAFLRSGGDQPTELYNVTIRASEGRLVITAPNGGERGDEAWLIGTLYDITWTHAGNVAGTVRLDYSLDGGENWQLIATGVSATAGRYPWTTPGQASENALVRIVHLQDATIYDESDGPFELTRRYQVVIPNGGEKWYVGETNDIVWGASFGLGAVSIDYSGDGTWAAPVKIGDFIPSVPGVTTNRYRWSIATNQPKLPSTNGIIRLQTFGGQFTDYSDLPFTMAGAAFTFPIGGSVLNRGTTYSIGWNSAECGSNMLFEAQTEAGGPWVPVDGAVSNRNGANSYVWTITSDPSEAARVRLTSTSDPRAKAISDVFTIAALVVQSPNGDIDPLKSERWLMESTQTVTWVSAGVSDRVNIRFSSDGGVTWLLLADDIPNSNEAGYTNEYVFTVPPIPSDQARIRVEDARRPDELWDLSDYNFQVAGVSVVWPNGPLTQEWKYNEFGTIRWLQNAVGSDAIVEFSYDGGETYENIVAPGVPVALSDEESPPYMPYLPTVRGMVRITPVDPSPFVNVVDTSDSFFAVAGVKVEAPTAGAQYRIGDTAPIVWVAAGTHDPDSALDIYYSGDGVNFDRTPAGAIRIGEIFSEEYPGRQSYMWRVERTREPSRTARVMIKAGDYESVSPIFTVKGVRFNVPAPGAVVAPGVLTLRWSQAGFALDAVGDIYLSTEGDVEAEFTTKITPTPVQVQFGSTPWTVPVGIEPTTNAVLKFLVTSSPSQMEDVGFFSTSLPFTLRGLSVKLPAQDDRWSLGATQTIRWRAASAGDTADFYYSSDDGATYDTEPVAQVVASADGYNEHPWTVEMWRMPSETARLKIVSSSGDETVSQRFVMEGIHILRPRSTDVYSVTDTTNRIRWVAVGDAGPYVLEYFREGEGPFPIATIPSGTEWNWTIPAQAVSTGVQVRVTGVAHANLSEPFRVVDAATVIFRAPVEGEFWRVGRQHTVEWSRGGQMPNDFRLRVSIKPYTETNEVADGAVDYDPERNVFRVPWSVPDRLTQARFIVTHNTEAGVGDVSGEFNMVAAYEVRLPNGGETLFALKPVPVIWRTVGSAPFVDVYYSITPPYKASSWIKANDAPIANNIKEGFEPEQTSWPWPVANIRSSLARVRVQEAQYPQMFDAGADGPYDDSDASFRIGYYTVNWIVMDARTSNRLDNLSVVDSSGWSASGLSCVPPSTIVREYPWGTWNTAWYRAFYSDKVVINWTSENLALGAPPVWTQTVLMTSSEVEPDYNVMANFAYKPEAVEFLVSSWMERGGLILDKPTRTRIFVYEEQGDLLAGMPVVNGAPDANGVFWTVLDASAMERGKIYFARVEIDYSGKTYSSGVTFEISVASGEDIVAEIVKELSNVESNLTGEVRAVGAAVADFRAEAMAGLTNLSGQVDLIATNTAGLTNLFGTGMADLTNQLAVLGSLTNMAGAVERLEADTVSTLAKILTRPETMMLGSTNTILYKTRSTYADDAVAMRVFNSRTGAQVGEEVRMQRIVGGIYQYTLVIPPSWPLGGYSIECADPTAADRIVFRVVPFDVYTDIGRMIADMSNVEASVSNLNASVGGLTNLQELADKVADMTGTFGDLSSNVFALMGITVGLESNIVDLVGRIGNLDLSILSTNVQGLSLSVSNMMERMGGVNLIAMESNVTATLGMVQGLQDLGAITNAVNELRETVGTNLLGLTSNLTEVTSSLQDVDFAAMYGHITNIQAQMGAGWTGGVSGVIGDISNAVGKIEALSRDLAPMAGSISNVAAQFDDVSLPGMYSAITNTESVVRGLGDMEAIGRDVSNAVRELKAMTNLSAVADSVDRLREDLQGVSFSEMAAGVSNIFGGLQGMLGAVDRMNEGLRGVSNVVSVLDTVDLPGMGSDVTNILARLNVLNIPELEDDLTNLVAIVRGLGDLDDLRGGVSNIVDELRKIEGLPEVSTNVALMKAKLDSFGDWPTNFSAVVDDLRGIDFGRMEGQLTNVVEMLRAMDVDELARIVGDLTNQMAGVNFADMGENITNVLARVKDLDTDGILAGLAGVTNALGGADLAGMSNSLSKVLAIVTGMDDLDGLSSNVTALAGQMDALQGLAGVDFDSLPRIERSLGGAVVGDALSVMQQFILILYADLSDVTRRLAGIEDGVGKVSGKTDEAVDQSTQASKNAQSAKTAASDASTAITQLRSEIEKGNMEEATVILRRLRESLAAAQESLNAIPKGELVTDVYGAMTQMAGQMHAFAASKGFDWLTKMREIPEALGGPEGVGAAADADRAVIDILNENMQEMRVSMEFMQELLDEIRNEPVVEESLIGVAE